MNDTPQPVRMPGDATGDDAMPRGSVPVGPGSVVTFDLLIWLEPFWTFDYPGVMLSPVLQVWEDGRDFDLMVEDACLGACVDGYLRNERTEQFWGLPDVVNRRWRLANLRRRFNEALTGKDFPVKRYQAERRTVRFLLDEDGQLTWEDGQ